uniref:PCNA-interacting partner n=1 Tax=Salvator merianae TaxID=96440 RepID=A0A8D0CD72_SALMN
MSSLQQTIINMIRFYRKQWHLFSDSERTTVCGADYMLMALQLSIAEVNKKLYGDFNASLSEVLLSWRYLVPDKLEIQCKKMEAPENYADIKSTYANFLKRCNMMDLIDVYQNCRRVAPENEFPSSAQLLEFIAGISDSGNEDSPTLSAPSTPTNRKNQDKEELPLMVKNILYAYLSLLVNFKNDLAFARILNIPERGLGKKAFSDLKHAAWKGQMSLFQTATSFIRTIELGGKGYAPSLEDPLRSHMKGLSHFVHFIDKLEEIMGEVLDPRLAGGRILTTIKTHLIKDKNSRDPLRRAAEEVVQDLDLRIKNIISFQQETVASNSTGISPARPKQYAINHNTVYCGRHTLKCFLALLDETAATPPSLKNRAQLLYSDEFGMSSVLPLFRSPTQVDGSSPKVLRDRIRTAGCKKEFKLKQPLIRSQFACTYKDYQMSEKKNQQFYTIHIPACLDSSSEENPSLSTENKSASECLHLQLESAALGTSSGNVNQNGSKSKEIGKFSYQPKNESSRRKQVEKISENVIFTNENESLQHLHSKRPKIMKCQKSLDSKIKSAGKCSKSVAKNKLIAGQGKLTQFFRL